jgi:3-phosphoshikimate 1-carboxyvinyltransferase
VTPRREGATVTIAGGARLSAATLSIPGDLSSAAFFVAAAAAPGGGGVCVREVGVNPTRTGILEVLEAMGAGVRRDRARAEAGEPVADLTVSGARLRGVEIGADLIPRLVDEVPILAVIAALADGETTFTGAGELRVKEVDRLSAVAEELGRLGATVAVTADTLRVRGGARLRGAVVSSRGDHRMAMSLAIAALFADGETTIRDVACVDTSFPGFARLLAEVAPACGLVEVTDDV